MDTPGNLLSWGRPANSIYRKANRQVREQLVLGAEGGRMQNDKSLVRLINEQRVLQEAFNERSISRSQISKNIGLNKVSVSEIVADLMNKGYLVEQGQGDSTRNGGRKPTILNFNRDLGYVISADLGDGYLDLMINRMDGSVVQMQHVETTGQQAEAVLGDLVNRITSFRAENNRHETAEPIPLMGVSVAIHGIVDDNQVLYSPFMDFKHLDVAQILESRLGVPVMLQNEANLSVIYVRDFNTQQPIRNLVCISIHKGIGAGIIIHDQLYTGKHGEAGEIGHPLVYDDQQAISELPTVESVCSETAVLAQLRQALGRPELSLEDVVSAYRAKDATVVKAIKRFCYSIANIIYNLTVSLSPDQVTLNSKLIAELPETLTMIKQAVPTLTSSATPITLVGDVERCSLLGGTSMIIHHVLGMRPGQLAFTAVE